MDVLLFGCTVFFATAGLRKCNRSRVLTRDPCLLLLQAHLRAGTSLNAVERVCIVTTDSNEIIGSVSRSEMRLQKLWHRATYVLIFHEAPHIEQYEDSYVLVQRRSILKDYYPNCLDPTPGGVVGVDESYRENAIRAIHEELAIDISSEEQNGNHLLERLFSFPYQDDQVKVWGEFFTYTYKGRLNDLKLQDTKVSEILRMSLIELRQRIDQSQKEFMPDSIHALLLYFQFITDRNVRRRRLLGYSSFNLDRYSLRPPVQALFFDCDDCLYFDNWTVANKLTASIDWWCVSRGLRSGQAYELYKQYGTALRGLLAEGYLDDNEDAIDGFLRDVHDIGVDKLLRRDDSLRSMLLKIDPAIPKYIFTASVAHHAEKCLRALGIDDLFVSIIDCKLCDFESKHSVHSFRTSMKIADVDNPESCLFFDDNLINLTAARRMGWRSVLVGRIGRDCGLPVTSEHAELEVDRIHDIPHVLPELFEVKKYSTGSGSSIYDKIK